MIADKGLQAKLIAVSEPACSDRQGIGGMMSREILELAIILGHVKHPLSQFFTLLVTKSK
jgi:hypothetical protein